MQIFIDESGCLGFDWEKDGTKQYLVITAVVCENTNTNKIFKTAVKRTLRNKVNRKSKHPDNELKGSDTPFSTKEYFYKQLKNKSGWSIYSVALNKKRVYEYLTKKKDKHKLYNHMVKFLVDQIPITQSESDVSILIDKSKNPSQREDFNKYLMLHFESKANLNCNVHLYHPQSNEHAGLQVVDLFCWGIARKLSGDSEWYNLFKDKIVYEDVYLK